MGCNTYFKLCCVIVILLLYRVFSATSEGCSNRSPRWRDFGGNYCFIIEENDTLRWTDAVYQCYSEGGSLASIHSIEDTERVIINIQNRTTRYYIGLRDRNDGAPEWVDKSAVDLTNWYPGEPNSYFERCTVIYGDNGKWNDVNCNDRCGYVCSSPKHGSLNELSPTKGCPGNSEDWRDFGGEFCYIIEEEEKLSRDGASSRCHEAGGSLASFHSFEDISAVVQHMRSHTAGFHIGLQINTQGTHRWLDGSPVDLYYFDIFHANSEKRKCVAMSPQSGEWFGVPCEYVLGYVCSARKVPTCVKHVAGNHGNFESSNYPLRYSRNEVCIWYITVPENSTVFLEFAEFRVEDSTHCEKDFVTVLDGHEETSPVLGKFCGNVVPPSIGSSENKMTVIFKSDDTVADFGIFAGYEEVSCGGVITDEIGVIRSPRYPLRYRANENCTWKIIAPESHRIFFEFRTLELEGQNLCIFDSIVIRDGLEPDDPTLGRFCGRRVPEVIISSSNEMSLTFVSDETFEMKGFEAKFGTTFFCGEVIADVSGVIRSPRYPSRYPINSNCTWKIVAPENHRIVFQFLTIQLEDSNNCLYDSVVIRDGLEPDDPTLGRFCGTTVPEVILSSSNEMSIIFVSDESIQWSGFEAIFETTDESRQVSLLSMRQVLYPLFSGEKIQAPKEKVLYKTVQTVKEKEQPEREENENVEVVLEKF